ncbi:MAG: DUF167 domain-containing protein [Actinomycetota bacterium]|nr:DUF167 domain-containing protein [Actinomycetota bacterium]
MLIEVRVLPRSSRSEVLVRGGRLSVSVTSPPERGKANAAAIEVLARWLKVGVSQLSVVSGKTSRNKLVFVPDDLEPIFRFKLSELDDHGV